MTTQHSYEVWWMWLDMALSEIGEKQGKCGGLETRFKVEHVITTPRAAATSSRERKTGS